MVHCFAGAPFCDNPDTPGRSLGLGSVSCDLSPWSPQTVHAVTFHPSYPLSLWSGHHWPFAPQSCGGPAAEQVMCVLGLRGQKTEKGRRVNLPGCWRRGAMRVQRGRAPHGALGTGRCLTPPGGWQHPRQRPPQALGSLTT